MGRAGHLRGIFEFYNSLKNDFCICIKLVYLGAGFLYRICAEIDYYLDKKCTKIIFFIIEKNKKYLKCPALQ